MEGCGCTVAVRYNPEVSRDVWWMGNIVRFLPRSEMKWDINCTPAAKVGGGRCPGLERKEETEGRRGL